MARFVNPYTFVPHAAQPERMAPAGHSAMGEGRFSGVLEITLTARTPLLIGGFGRKEQDGSETALLPHRQKPAGSVMIPGSGMMGAVRSVHEALAGGCLRVLDTERVPVHRHPANSNQTDYLHLAVVTKVDGEGRPTETALCDGWHWVPARLLPPSADGPVKTGDQLQYLAAGKPGEFPAKAIASTPNRKVVHARSLTHPDGVEPQDIRRLGDMGAITGDCKVVLVTDTNARDATRAAFFAVGAIGPDARRHEVPPGTVEKFRKAVDGANDLRAASLIKAGHADGKEPACRLAEPEYADVWWPPQDDAAPAPGHGGRQPAARDDVRQKIGRRLLARSCLHVGQPVWVAVKDGAVSEIRLSLLWRYQGDGPVGERVGAAKPCTDARSLCWSCRIFGSADTEGRADGELAVQNSYRGHVRIDDLLAEGDVTPVIWDLAPLASPKPSAGQFYLSHASGASRRVAEGNTPPTATWGSVGDAEGLRPVRGRKFYWRTSTEVRPERGNQRGKRREHQSETLGRRVALIPAGTEFKGRVTFDNLGSEDYGSLLAALNPRLLANAGEGGWEDAVISVGGGKPFGFGSVEVVVEKACLQTARSRYLPEPPDDGDPEFTPPAQQEAVKQFRAAVPDSVRANWQALRQALAFGFVKDEDVWYPPGGGERDSEEYDKSFEFFALTNGLRLTKETRPLVLLPDAANGATDQVLDSPAGRRVRGDGLRGASEAGETGGDRRTRGRQRGR